MKYQLTLAWRILAVAQFLVCSYVFASQTTETLELLASERTANDMFGWSVSGSGEVIVVGSPGDSGGNGAVYLFNRDGSFWSQQSMITVSGDGTGRFGHAVAISDNWLVVSSPHENFASGAVFIFELTGGVWTQSAKLLPADGNLSDQFGASVALQNNTIVVGATQDDDNGLNSGSAYVFTYNGVSWQQDAKIIPSDGSAGDLFGNSVSIDTDTIIIGASLADNGSSVNNGAAYIFVRSGTSWIEQTKIEAPDAIGGDNFGKSVGISGNTAVIGAYFAENQNGARAGAAYVYVRNAATWTKQAKLTASDGVAGDQFGLSVAIEGETIASSAYANSNQNGNRAGAVYVFERDSSAWTQKTKLIASDGADSDLLGWWSSSIAIADNVVIAGSPYHDHGIFDAGSAYVFENNASGVLQVEIDVKPGSDPNCFNLNGHGVLPVAILGSSILDVSTINTNMSATFPLSFNGLAVRVRGQKGPLCSSEFVNDDEFTDLVCQFEDDPLQWVEGTTQANLSGELVNGSKIEGNDTICIVP